jgi:predicted RNA-binding Zn-ribbon protein involved in translation (DUF1610 family)
MRICYNCGAEIAPRERVPFKELCPKCDAFLHCCKNCRLYSAEAHNHCLSHTTEYVPDVERGNFCDEYAFREIEEPKPRKSKSRSGAGEMDDPGPGGGDKADSRTAREKFEGLFKD